MASQSAAAASVSEDHDLLTHPNAGKMIPVTIRKTRVLFPYQPYRQQQDYMNCVLEAAQTKKNALLESPTGTGKTLSLLCASIAWLRSAKSKSVNQQQIAGIETEEQRIIRVRMEAEMMSSKPSETDIKKMIDEKPSPKVIYTSRTHTQLSQAVRELRKTAYKPKVAVMGSREQLCINPKVNGYKGAVMNKLCSKLVDAKRCRYYSMVRPVSSDTDVMESVMDIEELHKLGVAKGCCPYFLSKELHDRSEITFMPYNYLTDFSVRRGMKSIQDNVVIFDEAHNLEGVCSEAASFELSNALLASCMSEVQRCVLKLSQDSVNVDDYAEDLCTEMGGCTLEELGLLKMLLLSLETAIDGIDIPTEGRTEPGSYVISLLEGVKITEKTYMALCDVLEKASTMLTAESSYSAGNSFKGSSLAQLSHGIQLIFNTTDVDDCYRVHVFNEKKTQFEGQPTLTSKPVTVSRVVGFWCFSPGVTMRAISRLGVRSIILTSGTLSPMDSWENEMQIPFPLKLENSHVISASQVWVGVVPQGPTKKILNSSYKNRDSIEYKLELGNAIVNFIRGIPDGVLVFFPSYTVMKSCIDAWKESLTVGQPSIFERLQKLKPCFVEPRDSASFGDIVRKFSESVDNGNGVGGIFMAVCRGKLSEGIDFSDRHGRAVIVTGLPFPSQIDPRVTIKRGFMDEQCQKKKGSITGTQWYGQQAARAVNQAVGRVIRHAKDYGAILLCDERFGSWVNQNNISMWMRPSVKQYPTFGDAIFSLSAFFKSHTRDMQYTEDQELQQQKDEADEAIRQQQKSAMQAKGSIYAPVQKTVIVLPVVTRVSGLESRIHSMKNVPSASLLQHINDVEMPTAAIQVEEEEEEEPQQQQQKSSLSARLAQQQQQKIQQPRPQASISSRMLSSACMSRSSSSSSSIFHPYNEMDAEPTPPPSLTKAASSSILPCSSPNLPIKVFLEQLKTNLNSQEFKTFQGLMFDFKKQDRSQSSYEALFSRAKILFSGRERVPFLKNFVGMFPEKCRHHFMQQIDDIEPPNKKGRI